MLVSSFIWNIPFLWYQEITLSLFPISLPFFWQFLLWATPPLSIHQVLEFLRTVYSIQAISSTHKVSVALFMQTILKSLLQPRILSRSSDPYIKMSTRSLRHLTDILSATISKIWLWFSSPKLYLLVLYMLVNGPFTLLPKEKPGCHSPCHSFAFLMSKQLPSAVSVPLKYYYTNIYPLPLSTLIITNLIKMSSLLQNAAANCSQRLHATSFPSGYSWENYIIYHQNQTLWLKGATIDIYSKTISKNWIHSRKPGHKGMLSDCS